MLRMATLLKGSNIFVTEDLSKKTREHRHELAKFMKKVLLPITIILRVRGKLLGQDIALLFLALHSCFKLGQVSFAFKVSLGPAKY